MSIRLVPTACAVALSVAASAADVILTMFNPSDDLAIIARSSWGW